MVVFDVDGTLVGGEGQDWACFDRAFLEVAGFALTAEFFLALEEVTAKSIVYQALGDMPSAEKERIEAGVRAAYLRHLQAAHQQNPGCFRATPGAADLLQELRRASVPTAIATGDWFESITFKLTCAGVPFQELPMATASDHYSRADIITEAVRRAGGRLEETIYVGDGPWDLRACRTLGIPFIGIGAQPERLQAAGAEHLLPDLLPAAFLAARSAIRARLAAKS
jgi:phosphoglycolate phosphatase-like HAD superfamily hydrolase